jgi:hypothetical protein
MRLEAAQLVALCGPAYSFLKNEPKRIMVRRCLYSAAGLRIISAKLGIGLTVKVLLSGERKRWLMGDCGFKLSLFESSVPVFL